MEGGERPERVQEGGLRSRAQGRKSFENLKVVKAPSHDKAFQAIENRREGGR